MRSKVRPVDRISMKITMKYDWKITRDEKRDLWSENKYYSDPNMKFFFERYFLGKMDGIEIILQDSKQF